MWKPYKERKANKKELSHNLSEGDREVLRQIILTSNTNTVKVAFKELFCIYSEEETGIPPDESTRDNINYLSRYSPVEIILSYCEFCINYEKGYSYGKDVEKFIEKIKRFFEFRGLLYDFEKNEEYNKIEIYPIASDRMRIRHKKATTTLPKKGWEKEASLIRDAVSELKKGSSSYNSSLKSQYKALEVALKHTLSEINEEIGRKFKEKNISQILEKLRKEGFFSGAEKDHIRHLSQTIEKLSAFIGGKRKSGRHTEDLSKHEILFCLYGVDNIICYLIHQLEKI